MYTANVKKKFIKWSIVFLQWVCCCCCCFFFAFKWRSKKKIDGKKGIYTNIKRVIEHITVYAFDEFVIHTYQYTVSILCTNSINLRLSTYSLPCFYSIQCCHVLSRRVTIPTHILRFVCMCFRCLASFSYLLPEFSFRHYKQTEFNLWKD